MEEDTFKFNTEDEEKYKSESYKEMRWRYETIIKARNFHYENFNKWMTYFYVMLGALFVGVSYLVSKGADPSYGKSLNFILFIGFVVSLFWNWANKGYYYWNINFITLVNHYEKNILKFKEEERIYFVFANKSKSNYLDPVGGANISTSKLSILLSFIITCFWGIAFLNMILDSEINNKTVLYLVNIACTVLVVLGLSEILSKKLLSSYHKHFPDLNIKTMSDNDYRSIDQIST